MEKSRGIYTGWREEDILEEHMQDLLFSQSAEYDRERELLSHYTQPLRQEKRLFSKTNRAKNRGNSFIFTRRYLQKLPF